MPNIIEAHPEYERWEDTWIRQRDLIDGEDVVKKKGPIYLPLLEGQAYTAGFPGETPVVSSYTSYKNRATFLNATGRTLNGLVGLVMRKKISITWPGDQDFLKRAGRYSESFNEVAQKTLDEVVGVGRFGHLVDTPSAGGSPYIAEYITEDILDWEEADVNGTRKLVMIKLREWRYYRTSKDERKRVADYRILRLGVPTRLDAVEGMSLDDSLASNLVPDDFINGPVYFQEIWRYTEFETEKEKVVLTDIIVPRRTGGSVLHDIPFTFFNPTSTKAKPEKPVLLDLAVVNLSHYRNSADLEHGAHFTALPQPWASGFKFKNDQMFIGSGVAWVTDEKGASAGYLEFTGAGLGFLKSLMEDKKKEMAAMGARLLEEQTPSGNAEATQTVKLRQSGERSVLARVSLSVSEGLTKSLGFCAWFLNEDQESVKVVLNSDFGTEGLSGDQLRALMEAVLNGHLSWNTFMWNARLGEIIPDDVTDEDEAARITAGPPLLPMTTGTIEE